MNSSIRTHKQMFAGRAPEPLPPPPIPVNTEWVLKPGASTRHWGKVLVVRCYKTGGENVPMVQFRLMSGDYPVEHVELKAMMEAIFRNVYQAYIPPRTKVVLPSASTQGKNQKLLALVERQLEAMMEKPK